MSFIVISGENVQLLLPKHNSCQVCVCERERVGTRERERKSGGSNRKINDGCRHDY